MNCRLDELWRFEPVDAPKPWTVGRWFESGVAQTVTTTRDSDGRITQLRFTRPGYPDLILVAVSAYAAAPSIAAYVEETKVTRTAIGA